MSGVVMNAAYFALARALMSWLPVAPQGAFPVLAILVITVAHDQRNSDDPLRLPAKRLANPVELLIRRERIDRGRRSRRGDAVSQRAPQ